MPQQRLIFDYNNEGEHVPYWYLLTLEPCEINWDKPVFYYDAYKPSKIDSVDEVDDSLINMSIYFSDFIFNNLHPSRVGINLLTVRNRIEKHGFDPGIIQQFILSAELNEFLSLLPQEKKTSFLIR
jgi:hypothetical protein